MIVPWFAFAFFSGMLAGQAMSITGWRSSEWRWWAGTAAHGAFVVAVYLAWLERTH